MSIGRRSCSPFDLLRIAEAIAVGFKVREGVYYAGSNNRSESDSDNNIIIMKKRKVEDKYLIDKCSLLSGIRPP